MSTRARDMTARDGVALDELVAAGVRAVSKVLPAMGFESPEMVEHSEYERGDRLESTIGVLGENPVRLDVSTRPCDGEWVARTAFHMDDDEELDPEYVGATLMELSNVLAGSLLRELAVSGSEIGLPTLTEPGSPPPQGDYRALVVTIGEHSITVVLSYGAP